MRLADLRARIDRGEYRIDPEAVAEAIVRRLRPRPAPADELPGPPAPS